MAQTREELVAVIKGDIGDFKQKMAEVQGTVGNMKQKFNTLSSVLLKTTVAVGAVYGGFEAFKRMAASSSDVGDKLEKVTAGLSSGFQQLARNLVTLNFDNFIGSVQEAVNVGEELAERLDDLQDRTRSLKILGSEYASKIADLRLEASYETNNKEVRISAMKEAIRLQTELNTKELENAKVAKDIAMTRLTQESKLSEQQITNFLKQYNDQETLRNQAKVWIDEYKANVAIAGGEYVENLIQRYKDGFKGLSTGPLFESNSLVEAYARNLMKYGEAADNTINAAVDSLVKFNQVSAQGSQSLKGLQRQLNGLTDNQQGQHGTSDVLSAITPLGVTEITGLKPRFQELIDLGQRATRTFEQFSDTVSTKTVHALKDFKAITIDIGKELEYLAEGAVVSFAASLGNAISTKNFKGSLDNMLLMFADWAQNLGQVIIAAGIAIEGIKKWAIANPMAAVGLGIALVATAAAIKGAVNSAPVGNGGGSSGGGGGGGGDWNAFGTRNLRGAFTVEVSGVLTGNGRDLQAVLNNEAKRKIQ